MKNSLFVAAILVLAATSAIAADCTDVIRMSKTISTKVESKSDFESSAEVFCSEYKNVSSDKRSANYGISYKFIAASMGTSKASESEIASKVCSSKAAESSKKSAYDDYIETISDKAFDAYKACLGTTGIGFSVNSILPNEILFTVKNVTGAMAAAKMQFDASKGLKCGWADGSPAVTYDLPSSGSVLMKCTRDNAENNGSITIIATNIVGNNSFTLPWSGFDANGVPMNTLAALHAKVEAATQALTDATNSIKSAVVGFASDSCPAGWDEYKPAYGRFIRGLDKSKANVDPETGRTVGSLQADVVGPHNHNATLKLGAEPLGGGAKSPYAAGAHGAVTPTWVSPGLVLANDGIETRPKNVALLYCMRK